ncbi:hypothetical protein UT300012_24180 [Paraclostridium bifermentans]
MKLITARNKEKLEQRREDIYKELEVVGVRIQHAVSLGDASESAELDEAKDAQSRLVAELQDVNDKLDGAKVVHNTNATEVGIGSYIEITELDKETNMPISQPKLFVVDSVEDYFNGSLGIESPLAKLILGNPSGIYSVNTEFGLDTLYKVQIVRDNGVEERFEQTYPRHYKVIGEDAAFRQEDGTYRNSQGDLVDSYNRKIDENGNLLDGKSGV